MTSGSPSAIFCPLRHARGAVVNGSRGDCRVRGCVIYVLLLVSENYVTNCCRAGSDFILFGTGAELFMRIRSRIIIFEDPEPNYYFCINNNNFVIIFIFRIRSRIFRRIRSRIFRRNQSRIFLFLRIRSRIFLLFFFF